MSGSALPSSAPDTTHTRNSPLIVALVAAALFMENLDVTIITTALPQMAREVIACIARVASGINVSPIDGLTAS